MKHDASVRILIRRSSLAAVGSLLVAFIFNLIDWPRIWLLINGYEMVDRSVYRDQILGYNLSIDYIIEYDLLSYFTREWSWSFGLAYLNRDVGLSPEYIFAIVTILVLWRFCYEVASRIGWFYVPLLMNPLIIDFVFSQFRLALAIAIISFVWRNQKSQVITLLFYAFATTIHTSIVLFATMHLAAHLFNKVNRINAFFLISAGVVVSIAIGPLREQLLGAVGDRRLEYPDMASSVTYLSFWLGLWFSLLVQWRNTLKTLDGRYAIIILSIIVLNVIFSGYSTRFIVAAFPSLLVSIVSFRSDPPYILVGLFSVYSFLNWLYWLRILGG